MAVYVNNITVDTGSNFYRDFYLDDVDGNPIDLTGYTGKSEIRKHPESIGVAATFTLSFVDRSNGQIRLSLDRFVTEKIKPGRYVYDVMFTDSSSKKSIVIEGMFYAAEDYTPISECTKTEYAFARLGIILETSSSTYGTGSNPAPSDTNTTDQDVITINDISEYGVVHMGVNFNQCSTFDVGASTTRDLLENSTNLTKIKQYIQLGGVVWFNVEWWNNSANQRDCSDKANINAMMTLLGTTIRASDDLAFQGNADRSTDPAVVARNFPATENHNATVIWTGGNPVYTTDNGTKAVSVYEKIGNGILFVQGDSNIFSGPLYPTTYYDALRELVLNS